MNVAKKWLMSGQWNFLQVFIMILSIFFENLKILDIKLFDLELEKGQKFSLKLEAFDTLQTWLIAALN